MRGVPCKNMLLVGGGQEYHGPTAERDRKVVVGTARELLLQDAKWADQVEVVTGGMPGVGMDFAQAWLSGGGRHVRFIVSEEHMATLTTNARVPGVVYEVAGRTQAERRQALTRLPGIRAAFFVQGGQYTTDEIIKCRERELAGCTTVCFIGSGGASGGLIPYRGQNWDVGVVSAGAPDWMRSTNPHDDPDQLARNFARTLANVLSQ